MRTISCKLEDLKTMTLHIGYESENDYTSVRIDAGSVFAEYPQAVPSLKVQPPKGSTYPVNVTRDGTVVIWNVKESDTANNGNGEGQLTFTDGEVVKKCPPFKIIVHRSLKGNGTAPDPVQDWIDEASEIVEDAEEAAQKAEAAAAHAPMIGLDGYWYRWDAEAEEYVSTGTQAQGPEGEPGQPGEPGDPTELIDDTAGAGVTNKTLSADKLAEKFGNVLNAIQGKPDDIQINGTSIVEQIGNNKIANIPLASQTSIGAVKLRSSYGIQAIMNEQGQYDGTIAITKATDNDIKAGTNQLKPIVPNSQHKSVYYALAKLAGVDLASEEVTVGQYSQSALTAIQKMLGIYESPWELIREDTFTNASEADHDVSVDQNGLPFELTDVVLLFETPQQNTQASKGQFGLFQFFDGDSSIINAYCTAWTQNANAEAKGTFISVTKQKGGLYTVSKVEPHASGNSYMYEYVTNGFTGKAQAIFLNDTIKITKAKINSVTGTGHYILYGKRKWN